jgi:rod shape-determining protein MreB
MVVNIGAGTISAAVISISGIVALATERLGSHTVDTAILRYLRENHNFHIGSLTTEWVKVNFGQAYKTARDRRFDVRGQDLSHNIPKVLTLSTAEIREAVAKPALDMVKVVLRLLERVPPELSGDLVDRGMTLTGGGALLEGMDLLLREHTGIPVRIAPNALTAAVEGAGRMLDDFSLYRKFFVETLENAEAAEQPVR